MPFSSSIQGPKGDTGPSGNGASTDTYDKLYATNNGNGTNYKVGDDVWIGDVNISNKMSVKGVQDASKGGIVFGSAKTEGVSTNGIDLLLNAGNDIILTPVSTYAYLGDVVVDNRIATWGYVSANRFGASASFFSTADQTCTANSIQAMTLSNTDWATGISLESGSRIKMTAAGKYNIAFSAQLHYNGGGGSQSVSMAKGVLRFVGGGVSHTSGAKLKTPAASIGIRGGTMLVGVGGKECKTLAVNLYGSMEVVGKGGGAQSVNLSLIHI